MQISGRGPAWPLHWGRLCFKALLAAGCLCKAETICSLLIILDHAEICWLNYAEMTSISQNSMPFKRGEGGSNNKTRQLRQSVRQESEESPQIHFSLSVFPRSVVNNMSFEKKHQFSIQTIHTLCIHYTYYT